MGNMLSILLQKTCVFAASEEEGTRLSVKKMMNNIIEATILNGKFKGENVLLPRIPTIPTDVPVKFKRLQFSVRLAFAMTINKAQDSELKTYNEIQIGQYLS
jgi:hypothetical protein